MIVGMCPMSMSLLCSLNIIRMSMRVPAVAMSVIMEKEETEDVRCEAKAAHDKNQLRIGDFLRFDESLDCFEEDGKA